MIEHMFDRKCQPIPPGLDEMPPGPTLAGFLATIDPGEVSGHDRVVVLRAQQRMASHFQGQVYAAMSSLAEHMEEGPFADDPELAWEASATEIRCALRLTRRTAESELDFALGLQRLPAVRAALVAGNIDTRRSRVVVRGTSHLDEAAARQVVDAVIGDAPGLTTGELAARIRRLAIEVDPDTARERYEQTIADRRVVSEGSTDGTANLLGLDLPPDRVAAIARRINRIARTLNRQGDERTIDQLRADVFLDLLSGLNRDQRGGSVDLHVDLETLARLAETPGDLSGFGPVIADIARQVAEAQTNGEWRFTLSDPGTGLPIHNGTTRRRPSTAQRRTVEARDRTCIFPGCRMPATQCDLDHRIPWSEEKRTSLDGLDAGCRHDHVTVRHRLGWKHFPLPGGDHLWISPLGHRYTKSGRPP